MNRSTSRRLPRRTVLGLIGGAAAVATTGCAREFRQASGGSVPAEFASRKHIVAWHSFGGNLEKALNQLVDEFHKSQSDIYVELQFQGSYEASQQKLAGAIIAKQIPDMTVLSEVTWRQMHLADALEPLEGYFSDAGISTGDYIKQFIDEGTVQGHLWWAPFARSTPMFYFNRSVLAKAGLPDRGPKTWDEYLEWAPDITGVTSPSGGQVSPLTLGGGYSAWYFQGNMWQWKGNYSDGLTIKLDEPAGLEAGQWIVDFIHKAKAAYLSANNQIDFGNGAAAATLMSTASLTRTQQLADASKFDLGTAFLPAHEAFGCPTGGSGWGIMTAAPDDRKKAAFEFISFLGKPENSAFWTIVSGYLPIVKAAQKDSRLVDLVKKNPNYSTSLRQLPKTAPQDLARLVIPDASNFMDNSFETLYSSNASVEDVFGRLAKKMRTRGGLIEENYHAHYDT